MDRAHAPDVVLPRRRAGRLGLVHGLRGVDDRSTDRADAPNYGGIGLPGDRDAQPLAAT